eukprot:TRINITY_DN72076_c0_g1_i1.p1 TRINITY_DN72076_c0_g1~~TRINITY_DN72076_c0_g1_i1.p1  ORF type:complete len:315 (-),score=37.85 TRINITY_DN72076_c0_g1_i1:234-1136(-)
MTHVFEFSDPWGKKLSEEAPPRGRNRGLVKENQELVAQRGFTLESGERVDIPEPPGTERVLPPCERVDDVPRFDKTVVTVALMDTLSGALALGPEAAALNFANAHSHGGGYKWGAQAQEEDLCRLLPQLIHSLEYVKYPIRENEGECLVTRGLVAVREVSTYELCRSQGIVNMLTSAMPCGDRGRPESAEWTATVNLRVRGVLHAAKICGFTKLVLGAWGCGAFGNPPDLVAQIFREQLSSPEFRGAFSDIVFAIIDPKGDGNYQPFYKEIRKLHDPTLPSLSQDALSSHGNDGGKCAAS